MVADWIIDERAIRYTEWGEVVDQILHAKPAYGGPTDEGLLHLL